MRVSLATNIELHCDAEAVEIYSGTQEVSTQATMRREHEAQLRLEEVVTDNR